MTVSDFNDEVKHLLAREYFDTDPAEAKDELMEEVITRKVLLQEAQKQNLDKERVFMREIERYWEQSLLKVLTRKMSEELSKDISVDDSEVINEYQQMKRRLLAELTILNDKKAAEKLTVSGGNYDKVREKAKSQIISGGAPAWFVIGDLPLYLERPLFSLKEGELSGAIECGKGWAVLKLLKEEETTVEPFKKVALLIKKNIFRRKKEKALEEWTTALRSKAAIKVNKKILGEIELK